LPTWFSIDLLPARRRGAGDRLDQVVRAHLQEAAIILRALPTKIASTAVFMLCRCTPQARIKQERLVVASKTSSWVSHHLIEPVACTPAAGWEKGQVENQVGNLRDQLFRPKPRVTSLTELNGWLEDQCIAYARRTSIQSSRTARSRGIPG